MFSVSPAFVESAISDSPGLLARAQRGDSESFCQLCRLHGTRLLRQATALCGDVTLAEDLAQETMFEAWKSIHRYHGRCRFFTWLCAILLNRYRNVLRQKRPLPLSALCLGDRESAESMLDRQADTGSPPDRASEITERAALLRRCIDQLPRKHREVIYLRFYVDDSLEGIAAAVGCSVGTVKSRLFNAVERLRAMKSQAPGFSELNLK